MRDLLDRYVEAEDPRVISSFGDKPLLDIIAHPGIIEAVKSSPKWARTPPAEGVVNIIRRALNDAKPQIRFCMKKCRSC